MFIGATSSFLTIFTIFLGILLTYNFIKCSSSWFIWRDCGSLKIYGQKKQVLSIREDFKDDNPMVLVFLET